MSTFFYKDGDDLQLLIAGDNNAWNALIADWHDRVLKFASLRCPGGDYEALAQEGWVRLSAALRNWKPGQDTGIDEHGNEVSIHNGLSINFVTTIVKCLARREAKRSTIEKTTSIDQPFGLDGATLAGMIEDSPDRGKNPEQGLVEELSAFLIENRNDEEGEGKEKAPEGSVREMLEAMVENGTLLTHAVDVLIKHSQPPLDESQKQAFVRRWLSEQSYLQIGRDLNPEFHNQAETGMPDSKVTNWANSQYQSALRRISRGLDSHRRDRN